MSKDQPDERPRLNRMEGALRLQVACEGIEAAMEHIYETLVEEPATIIALDPARLAIYASHFWRLAQDSKRQRGPHQPKAKVLS